MYAASLDPTAPTTVLGTGQLPKSAPLSPPTLHYLEKSGSAWERKLATHRGDNKYQKMENKLSIFTTWLFHTTNIQLNWMED